MFEIDQPRPQARKRQRLIELGFGIPEWLRLVPVDFEAGPSWWDRLVTAGFDAGQPAVVASTGVAMYLTRDATVATLLQIAALATGSTLAMTFMLPLPLVEPEERPGRQATEKFARAAGGHPSSASSPRWRCWLWPAKPVFERPSTCRQPVLLNATSPEGRMAFGHRAQRSRW